MQSSKIANRAKWLSVPWRRHGGMTSVDSVGDVGDVGPACKAAGFMTNDEYRHCFGGLNHIQSSTGRAKSCEKYPPRLVASILRALRQSMRAAGRSEV